MKNVKKCFKGLVCVLVLSLALTIGMGFGMSHKMNASVATNGQNSEEVLLKKDKLIKNVVSYKEGVNPYWASSKASRLANLDDSKLEEFSSKGYTLYVTDEKADEDLAEPVRVEGKKVIVSIYSNDDELVRIVNKLV